jgi:prepilin-type N-terminal cleavage/methylation domain-containing protein/prepilin-type processing-associated H-X9-DG protein
MNNPRVTGGRTTGFTLVELLCVIGIIALLAALLLPALSKGKDRAKLAVCQNNLSQIGIAFHSFAHDHNSKFPMETPLAEGGTKELMQNGYLVNGEFYYAYRNFLVLADPLQTPRMLVCPTDTREAATNFTSFKNDYLSYFVGGGADYNQPDTVLAGDRNLAGSGSTSLFITSERTLQWSGLMHQYKGNLLYADGHVVETRSVRVARAGNDFFIPTGGGGGGVGSSGGVASVAGHAGGTTTTSGTGSGTLQPAADATPPPPPTAKPAQPAGPVGNAVAQGNTVTRQSGATMEMVVTNHYTAATNAAVVTNALKGSTDEMEGMSEFNRKIVKSFNFMLWVGVPLWLLLLVGVMYMIHKGSGKKKLRK